jgi:uncharacterized phage protein (TIGR01671 family)
MRERVIKFRYWDEEMVLSQDMTMEAFWAYFSCEPAGKLMQFTGLQDKNGKDIYEGDVVTVKNWAPSGQKPTYSNMVVEWVEIGGSDDMGTDMIGFRDHSGDEVIGNVHENSELLMP